jgi:LmbE family N-acetylglucosaminyl deacetylase
MSSDQRRIQRALFVMAHPDDIEFMAGGLAARWAREGVELHYCLLTDGESGARDPSMSRQALVELRRAEQRAAGELLGVREITFLGHPDGRLVPSVELRLEIARAIRRARPDAVVTSDPRLWYRPGYVNHPDHRAAGEATLAAVMPLANTLLAAPELTAEGLEPHDVMAVFLAIPDAPTHYVELSEQDLEHKVAAMGAHTSQVEQFPDFARLIRQFAEEGARQGRQERAVGTQCTLAEAYVRIVFGAFADELPPEA